MGIPIGIDVQTDKTLDGIDHFTGTYIVGKSGMGKSTLITSMIARDLVNGNGLLVMEPKGDLVEAILAIIPKEREKDVILLDFGDPHFPPGFDLFDGTSLPDTNAKATYIREVVAGFKKTLGTESWGIRMEEFFMAVAATFMENPGTTMVDMPRMLRDEQFRRKCVRNLKQPYSFPAKMFWQDYDNSKSQATETRSTMSRVNQFLFDPVLVSIVVQSGKSLDVLRAIREKQIVLISLPERLLGARGVSLFGTLLLSRIRLAAMKQFDLPERERTPFFVYLDEFQRFATADIESFIAEARAARVGLTMAHQWRSQIDDPGVRTAPLAAGNKIIFQVIPEDAAVFARDFSFAAALEKRYTPPQELRIEFYGGELQPLVIRLEKAELAIVLEMQALETMRSDKMKDSMYERAKFRELGDTLRDHIDEYLYYRQHKKRVNTIWREYAWGEWRIGDAVALDAKRWTLHSLRTFGVPNIMNWERDLFAMSLEAAKEQIKNMRATWTEAFDTLVSTLVEMGDYLEEHPSIDYYWQHQAEESSKSEIASSLSSLPPHHAHCKLNRGERTVELTIRTTTFLPEWDVADPEAIRNHSRASYCLSVDDALALVQGRMSDSMEADIKDNPDDSPPRRGAID